MARATAEGAKRETLHSMLRSRPRHRRLRPPSDGQPLRPCAESERALLEQRCAEFPTCPTDRYSHASPGSRGTPPRSCLLSVLCCPAASGAGRTRNWKSAPFAISYCCLRCGKRPQLQIRVRREPRSVRGLFGAVARRRPSLEEDAGMRGGDPCALGSGRERRRHDGSPDALGTHE